MGIQTVWSQPAMVSWASPSPSVPRMIARRWTALSLGSSMGDGGVAQGHGRRLEAQVVQTAQSPSSGHWVWSSPSRVQGI